MRTSSIFNQSLMTSDEIRYVILIFLKDDFANVVCLQIVVFTLDLTLWMSTSAEQITLWN